jgi:hypothetical protein
MTADPEPGHGPVELTAHPLQRVGAFALAALAGVREPGHIDETGLLAAVGLMHDDLKATTGLDDSKGPGGFWLGASQFLWPNSPLSHPKRGKQSVQGRREWLEEWRTLPDPDRTIGVPCALCGRAAGRFYGKVDVPLAASTAHRNTTARGHEGLALCRGCLACFHALPYGCAISGGRAAVVHSWDDQFLRAAVAEQVRRMRRNTDVAAGAFGVQRPYARQVAALRQIRSYDRELTAGVELFVFKNGNRKQDQTLDLHQMAQPLAEWLRRVRFDPRHANGWRYLNRAHATAKVPGQSMLARNLFDRPGQVVSTSVSYLREHAGGLGVPPGETPDLGALCSDYAIKVLDVNESDNTQIRGVAVAIAARVSEDESEFKKFAVASRSRRDLQGWLRRRAVDHVRYSKEPDAFITERQWLLLFDSADQFLHRDLLLIAVLGEVHRLDPKWRRDDPDARKEADDDLDKDKDEEGER